jgi:O-antigen/teichoic acid export membrane protein
MPQQRRFLFSAVTNWLAFAATLLVAFFLSPYLIGKLGDSRYGVWVFVESILAYFTLFDLGIAAGVVRFTAKYHAEKNQHELNRLASACLALFLGLGIIAFLLGFALTPVLAPMMSKSGMQTSEIATFTLLMLGNLALSLPLNVFPSILDGLERFAAKSLVRIVFLAARTIAIVMLMEREQSLIGLAIIFTIGTLAEHFVMALLCWKYIPRLRFGLTLVDREMLRRVKGYSLNAFLAMIAGRVSVQSAAIIIGIFLSAPEITWFAIALRLVEFAKALLRSATTTLTPAISSLEAAGDMDAIRRVLLKGTRWVLYLILPVHIGLIVFGKPFLTIWLGSPDYATRCYPALVILSATLSLVLAQSVASRILYGMGKLRRFAFAALGEAALNLTLSLLLVQSLGIVGIAWAAALPNLLFCLFVISYACRTLGVRAPEYLCATWLRPLMVAIVPVTIWLSGWTVIGWGSLALAIAAGLIPYGLAVVAIEHVWPRFQQGKLRMAITSDAAPAIETAPPPHFAGSRTLSPG